MEMVGAGLETRLLKGFMPAWLPAAGFAREAGDVGATSERRDPLGDNRRGQSRTRPWPPGRQVMQLPGNLR